MAGIDNLKGHGFDERSADEARESGRKGGVNSGKTRRRKKAIKERLLYALELGAVDEEARNVLAQVGMDPDGTNYDAVVASIVAGAIQREPGYAKLLLDLIGETGSEKRAAAADRRDKKRLDMEVREFEMKNAGNTEDNDNVLRYIEGMKCNDPSEPDADGVSE